MAKDAVPSPYMVDPDGVVHLTRRSGSISRYAIVCTGRSLLAMAFAPLKGYWSVSQGPATCVACLSQ